MMKPSWKSSVGAREGAGGHAADVGVVGAVGDEADEGGDPTAYRPSGYRPSPV